jgi:hypothetical protein
VELTFPRAPVKALRGRVVRERDVERELVRQVKAAGGEVRKVRWVGRRGAPDRLVMLPARARCNPTGLAIWVELKAPGVGPEAYQLREHARMRALGQDVRVVDSLEGIAAVLG